MTTQIITHEFPIGNGFTCIVSQEATHLMTKCIGTWYGVIMSNDGDIRYATDGWLNTELNEEQAQRIMAPQIDKMRDALGLVPVENIKAVLVPIKTGAPE